MPIRDKAIKSDAIVVDTPLFGDLPEAVAPLYLYTDEHVLEPCSRCDGTGRERPPEWWSAARVALFWDPACRVCGGAGKRVVFVGKVRDV